MPGERYSRVLRGHRGAAAREKLLQYLGGLATQGEGIGTRGNRPALVPLYVEPFAIPLGDNVLVTASALEPAYNAFQGLSAFSSRVNTTAEISSTETTIKMSSYSPPRVVRRSQTGTTGTRAVSKRTGLPYLKYNVESLSVPFGQGTSETETVLQAFTAIVAQARGQATNLKFSLIDERY